MYYFLDDYYADNEIENIKCFDCSLRQVCHESRNISADNSCIVGTINTLLLRHYSRLLPDADIKKDSNIYNKFVWNNKLGRIRKVILVDTYDERTFRSFLLNYKDTIIYGNSYPKDKDKNFKSELMQDVLFTNSYLLYKLSNKALVMEIDKMTWETLNDVRGIYIDRILNKSGNVFGDFQFLFDKLHFRDNMVVIDFYRNKHYYKELLKEYNDIQVVIWDIKK